MGRVNKSVSMKPEIVLKVESLVENGEYETFSEFVVESIEEKLNKNKEVV